MPDTALRNSSAAEGRHEAYEIAERIAVGPAGIVYRAIQVATNRDVIFKVLNPEATHPLDSARVSAIKSSVDAVRQRWIAEWIDAYQDDDGFVLVFDYKKVIAGNFFPDKDRRLSAEDGLRLAAQFCEVLQAAELAALPHGDLKPSNIILWNDPAQGFCLQVLDWGLSICRAQHPEESLECMSPERLQGGAPTLAGDFFSVGVTLTFLLTGYYPVKGSHPEAIITAWRNFNPASIANLRPDLGEHFCQWLAKLMSLDPKDRPFTAARALDSLKQADAAIVHPPSTDAIKVVVITQPRPVLTRAPITPSTRLISSGTTVQIKGSESSPATKPTRSRKTRVLLGVLTACIIATLAVLSCIWVKQRSGLDWNQFIASRWHHESLPSSKSQPAIIPSPSNAPLAATAPITPPVKPAVVIQMRDTLMYPAGTNLDGNLGGSGWSAPWRASNIQIALTAKKQSLGIALGGQVLSNLRRNIAAFDTLDSGGICLVCTITLPGAEGPTLSLDVLASASSGGPAPVLLIPKGDKLIVSIPKITQTVEIANKGVLRIATLWNFKKQADGKYEGTQTVFLNPVFNRRNRNAPPPSLSHITQDYIPPEVIELSLASIGASKQSAIISDIRIARTLVEAVK